jgi:DNA-damage-inducible protein D
MKAEQIKELFAQFEATASEYEGIECWSARELQHLLGYSKWENFQKVIDKAKESCKNAGEPIGTIFPTSGRWFQLALELKKRSMIFFFQDMPVT